MVSKKVEPTWALVFGPQGLNEGKIQSLIGRDTELLKALADYADQSSRVESLIQELADAEQSGVGTDAVLKGFSSQYGVAAPKLDIKASSDQQASILLKALLPAAPHQGEEAVPQQINR